MRFGFSYVGFVYLVMLLVPNLIWAKNGPGDYARYAKNENRILLFLERTAKSLSARSCWRARISTSAHGRRGVCGWLPRSC